MQYYCEDPELDQLYREHATDAGFDICSADDKWIIDGNWVPIKTGLHLAIPEGKVGILKARSGLSLRVNTDVHAGVLDACYRGEVIVLLSIADYKAPFHVKKGDRIAQLLVLDCDLSEPERVNSLEELGNTDRGAKGFARAPLQRKLHRKRK